MTDQQTEKITILHYSAPPVIGGVEAVIKAHLNSFIKAGYNTKVIAGRGESSALPPKTEFTSIPEIDTNHHKILELNKHLENGEIPPEYSQLENKLFDLLKSELEDTDYLIIHNLLTKHFNLPLTGALVKLVDQGLVRRPIAWSHDFTWTSSSSRHKVHPGYPWDLLRTKQPDWEYVVVSEERRQTLAGLFECDPQEIKVIYNGVSPDTLLGLSPEGVQLADRLQFVERDLIILMPVRVTTAKNIEFAEHVLAELKDSFTTPLLLVTGPPDPHDSNSMAYYHSLLALRQELGLTNELRFIFESGPESTKPIYIDENIVGELFRWSDVVFMPSHREGFGMPILEAGLAGIPVVSRPVPAASELAGDEADIFNQSASPKQVGDMIVNAVRNSPTSRLRQKVRRQFTWQAIFSRDIEPLLKRK